MPRPLLLANPLLYPGLVYREKRTGTEANEHGRGAVRSYEGRLVSDVHGKEEKGRSAASCVDQFFGLVRF
jgi:hypothetical protein